MECYFYFLHLYFITRHILFLPIIQELEKREIKSAYWTSKIDDDGLKTDFKFLFSKFIGNGISSFTLLLLVKFIPTITSEFFKIALVKRPVPIFSFLASLGCIKNTKFV